ncbi:MULTISPECIES: DJ-1/PfpI family protein [unclassified Rhizobium]|uniref:DJ-1/PfpI family protein n=1 Tax=Rhizobium TaxID=379 RepID=UPI00084C7F27|nr:MULTISPECIES: DJ-1/PfpI family protein [unclassified Rhizobium]OEC95577.1 AraC family transcriptional regulator [Rhizobium sp. YK2]QYA15188.1 DJ-1/PfpI family protein [Rhizobium sp. AB2/73]UEQ83945.1 DJ-1/PfpI family protein [Rhizobium sp. AB2/73]
MTIRFGLLAFPGVQQLDLTAPYEVFASMDDAEVHLVWKDTSPVVSATKLVLRPTTTFAECPPFDVICVPGGIGVNALLEDMAVLSFIREQATRARFVTSVCTGSLVLGAAGLLKGKKATTHWNALDFLESFGAVVTPGRVVRDGNLFTAGGVTAGIDFGLTIAAALCGREDAEAIQLSLEYAPEPPFHSGLPEKASAEVLARTRQRLAGSRMARQEIVARLTAARHEPG